MNRNLSVHVIYEYGVDTRPHGSAYLRLIRPLTYPDVSDQLDVTFGRDLGASEADLVLVDRLWRPDIHPQKVRDLAAEIHRRGGKLVYWFDDNFLEVGFGDPAVRNVRKDSFACFLEESDALVVTTRGLEAAFRDRQKPIAVLQNALDERLIVRRARVGGPPHGKITIGYMGTGTHDNDLRMILPAMQAVSAKYPGQIKFQIIGALDEQKLRNWEEMSRLPVEILEPLPVEIEYPLFMVWFTGSVQWDFALAPLVDNVFNKSKSDIKFLDYSAAGVPAVVSAVDAYASTVVDHQTGLVVENDPESWTAALDEMIRDSALRARLAENASSYLFEQRVLRQRAGEWVKYLHAFHESLTRG